MARGVSVPGMDDHTSTNPFHRYLALRALTCVALMALVFGAGRLFVIDGPDGAEGGTSTASGGSSSDHPASPASTPGPEATNGSTPAGDPGPADGSFLELDGLSEPLEEATTPTSADAAPLGGGATGPSADPDGWSSFAPLGPQGELSLSAPDQWTTTEDRDADVVLLAAPDRGDGLPVEVLVTWQERTGETVGEVADGGRAALAAGLDDFNELAFEETALAGRDAYRLHATYTAADGTGREVQTWWVQGGEGAVYVLNATRSDAGDPNDWRDAQSVIASLTFGEA